ncbi:MAG: arsenate reductase ArsC [Candidatus Bipolaricaulota bacterium]|nr:arsenate reductase ArsC [Candidatus Bipolaricaulota bacterium]
MTAKTRVLFLCVHNSARSQMAEGILRHLAGDRYEVASAGSRPTAVHPLAVAVLAERGVDISGHRAKDVRELLGQKFDLVVTLCGDEAESCPFFPGAGVQEHVPFADPAAEGTVEAFRRVRDELWGWIISRFVEGGR